MARSARGKVILVGFPAFHAGVGAGATTASSAWRAASRLSGRRPTATRRSREEAGRPPQRPPSAGSPSKPGGSWAPSAFWNIASCV